MVLPSVGILFDIDQLGETEHEKMFYGDQARLIFMQHFDPATVPSAAVWFGDTQATLNGDENRFCIAVTARQSSQIVRLRDSFQNVDAKGLAARRDRFLEGPVNLDDSTGKRLGGEPLILWCTVNPEGVIVLSPPAQNVDIELCRRFGRKFKLSDDDPRAGIGGPGR